MDQIWDAYAVSADPDEPARFVGIVRGETEAQALSRAAHHYEYPAGGLVVKLVDPEQDKEEEERIRHIFVTLEELSEKAQVFCLQGIAEEPKAICTVYWIITIEDEQGQPQQKAILCTYKPADEGYIFALHRRRPIHNCSFDADFNLHIGEQEGSCPCQKAVLTEE